MANDAVNVEVLNRYSTQIRHIKLRNAAVCGSIVDVEAEMNIDDEQQAFLAKCYAKGCVKLFVMTSEKTGGHPTPSFVIEGIYGKVKGGSGFSKVADIDAYEVSAEGVYQVQQFTVSLGSYIALKLFTSGGAWVVGDTMKMDVWLICELIRND